MSHAVLKRDQHIGNDLLVGRIDLSLTTRKKEIVSARKECVEISLGLEAKALETAKLIEQSAPDHQNVFNGRIH